MPLLLAPHLVGSLSDRAYIHVVDPYDEVAPSVSAPRKRMSPSLLMTSSSQRELFVEAVTRSVSQYQSALRRWLDPHAVRRGN